MIVFVLGLGKEVYFDEEVVTPRVQFKEVKPTIVKMSTKAYNALESNFLQSTYLDRQYGEIATIDGLWIFKEALDVERIKTGLELLLDEVPSLAGRINSKRCGFDLTNDGAYVYVREATGSYKDFSVDIEPRADWIDKFPVQEIFAGKCPTFTVTITHLLDGGSVLGLVVSHMVAGGNGFFGYVVPRFAALVKYLKAESIPEGELGSIKCLESRSALPASQRSLKETKAVIKTLVKEQGMTAPLSFRDPIFGKLKRRVIYTGMRIGRGRPRVHFYFGPEELKNLKTAAMKDVKNTKWLSTGEALCAHLSRIIAKSATTSKFSS